MVQERGPTGIMGLDELVRGGLPRGKTYLVSGEAGAGKTVFCMQYVLHGLSLGENCVYFTVDGTPAHLV